MTNTRQQGKMAETKGFRRGSATTTICDILRREILTLELEPGQPLDETLLSKRFEVSRSPIREVLNRLIAERLAVTLPNRATIVAPVDLTHFSHFIEALDLQQRYASRLAARHRTSADLVRLREQSEEYTRQVKASHSFGILQSNYEFHRSIAEAGKNPYVVDQYSDLLLEARRLLHLHIRFLQTTGQVEILDDQHDDFLAAIEARDVERADAVAHAHTYQFHDRFLKTMCYAADGNFRIEQSSVWSATA